MSRFSFGAFFALCALFSAPAGAAEALGMVTGPATGTYIAIGRDIAESAAKAGISIAVKPSGGSVDNIKRLNSKENAALGIVQSDVLNFLNRSQNKDTRKMAENLRLVLPLYREEVHLLARKEIANIKDLQGKRVAVGEDGSGHMLTAVNLLALSGVAPQETVRLSPPEGVLALLDGKVDALFFVGGKPVKLFKNLESLKTEDNARYQNFLSSVHFLPLRDPRMLEEYYPAELTHEDYAFISAPVPTVAVTAVLIAYDFSATGRPNRKRCRALYALNAQLRADLPRLQESGHPKWREVSLDAPPPIWKKDVCAWEKPPEKAEPKKTEKKFPKKPRAEKPKRQDPPLPRDVRKVIHQR